ncbi:MAG TPA: LysM peptidoglycan-binding domain-containing protein, partial [Acidobacteriota bacterium]|nr:LysM peptidoglycan-binding domain-containing protein [Acidobacteriota bacterium]
KILYGLRRSGAGNFWRLASTRYIRQETKNYVPAFLAAMIIAKDPQKYGFNTVPDRSLHYDVVHVDYTVDLRLVAECSGASLEQIKMLNPELNRLTTPSRVSSYPLRIPKNTKEVFMAEIAGVPEDKRITWRKHEVKEGETLTEIAAIYRTSTDSIMSANAMGSEQLLNIGQKIVIPIRATPTVSYDTSSRYTSAPGKKNYHAVRSGDTLGAIARRYGVSVNQLCAWNGITSRTTLKLGRSLIVRFSPTTMASNTAGSKKILYQVKRGDTLYQIANNYNIDVESIRKWNKIAGNGIQPGDRLTIYRK